MTPSEADAALAANPASVYFAGRDLDQLVATILVKPTPGPWGVLTVAENDYANDTVMVAALRAAIDASPDQAARLIEINTAIATIGATLGAREARAVADAKAAEQAKADQRAAVAERQRQDAIRQKISRAVHPAFSALRAQILAAENRITGTSDQTEHDAAQEDLVTAFAAASASIPLAIEASLS